MKILVAGATGVIGRLLLPKLVHAGHEVIGLSRQHKNKEAIHRMGAHALIADVYDREAILSTISEIKPDIIIHQLTDLSARNFSDNARIREEGTRNLVDAARKAGVPRMIAQSISWAYEPGDIPASEEDPLDLQAPMPRKRLIESIRTLEQTVAEIPDSIILRYGMFYGPDTWYVHNGFMAERILHKEVPATEGVTSFVHVEDAANAVLLALDWPAGPVNIVDDEPAKGTEWLPVYAYALGAPMPDIEPHTNRGERGASNDKARRKYGWKPLYPSWRNGFAQSLNLE